MLPKTAWNIREQNLTIECPVYCEDKHQLTEKCDTRGVFHGIGVWCKGVFLEVHNDTIREALNEQG